MHLRGEQTCGAWPSWWARSVNQWYGVIYQVHTVIMSVGTGRVFGPHRLANTHCACCYCLYRCSGHGRAATSKCHLVAALGTKPRGVG